MSHKSTNRFFTPGKLTTLYDMGAGSSGKAKMSSFVTDNADNWTFACNTFAPQAGHWTRLDDGRTFFYQTLNSCAYNVDKYEKLYIGPGGMIELPALFRELEENKVPDHKLGISPMAMILEDIDSAFERGTMGFDGDDAQSGGHEGTKRFGSTCHGVGSANARRILRRPSVRLAKDIPELSKYICNVQDEITTRLDRGEAGLLELAQGFQLSLLHSTFYPHVTSRQVTVAQGFSDMFLAPKYMGQTIGNLRTFPIRINSNKYISLDGKYLIQDEIDAGTPHTIYKGDSGPWYPDQKELTWDEVTKYSGSPVKLREITSVTKLARRVASFSKINVLDALRYNDTGHEQHLAINFANYVDHSMSELTTAPEITIKFWNWLHENLGELVPLVKMVGTGATTSQTIILD